VVDTINGIIIGAHDIVHGPIPYKRPIVNASINALIDIQL